MDFSKYVYQKGGKPVESVGTTTEENARFLAQEVKSASNSFDPSKFVQQRQSPSLSIDQTSQANVPFQAEVGESPITAGLKAAGNVPSSAFNLAKNIFNAITNPMQTLKGVGQTAVGGARTLGEKTGIIEDEKDTESEEVFDQFAEELKKRYGSLDALQKTATEDPFTFGADLLAIATGGAGLVRKGLGTGARTALTPEQVGGRAARLAKGAEKKFGEVLRPTKEATKKITKEKVAPGLAERKIKAYSLENLNRRTQREIEISNQRLNEALDNVPDDTRVQLNPIIDDLENTKNRFVKQNEAGENIVVNAEGFKAATDLQETLAQFGDEVDFKTLREVRQVWDDVVDKSNGFTKDLKDFQKLNIQKGATNSIRRELAKERPNIDIINKEISFWLDAQDVVSQTIQRTTGQSGGIGEKLFSAGGGLAGSQASYAAFGDPVSGFLAGAAIGQKLSRAFQSPLWKTVRAKRKRSLAEAIAKGDRSNMNRILSVIAVETGINLTTDDQE